MNKLLVVTLLTVLFLFNMLESVVFRIWLRNAIDSRRKRQILQDVDSLVKLRTGQKGYAVWYYQGVLRSSMTGDEIAGVEGLEFIRLLSNSFNRTTNTRQASYLTKKVFVYVDKTNRSQPLEYYRKQKVSPARATKPVKVLEEIVTLSACPAQRKTLNTSVLWPGGRVLNSKKISLKNVNGNFGMVEKLLGRRQMEVTHSATGLVSSPLLFRLISFASPSTSSHGKTQEYYVLNSLASRFSSRSKSIFSSVQMKYKRFGESPPWFATNRGGIIELQGYRFDRLNKLPRGVREGLEGLLGGGLREDYGLGDFSSAPDPLSQYLPWYKKILRKLPYSKNSDRK